MEIAGFGPGETRLVDFGERQNAYNIVHEIFALDLPVFDFSVPRT